MYVCGRHVCIYEVGRHLCVSTCVFVGVATCRVCMCGHHVEMGEQFADRDVDGAAPVPSQDTIGCQSSFTHVPERAANSLARLSKKITLNGKKV